LNKRIDAAPLRLKPLTAIIGGAFAYSIALAAHAQTVAPTVEVVGTSPVPGLDQPKSEIPSNVQSISKRALRDTGAAGLPELLGSQLQSVNVNEIQGNPYQADVNYRGFTASPLLGTPQGLSVYQDGVRINEPFGDIVNWDLIPRNAIASIDLIPGSNPLFGLNTLGGALSIRTKDGFSAAGTGIEAYTGSFGRHAVTAEHGGNNGELGWYFTATRFEEDGWRDASPSEVNQYFGKISHRTSTHEFDLNLTHADSDLIGNGLTPLSFYEQRRKSIFTSPDNTRNQMTMLSLNGGYWLDDIHKLSGTAYVRRNNVRTLNGDANDEFDLPGDPEGVLNRTRTRQSGYGFSLQWAEIREDRQLAVGTTFDHSRTKFQQTEQEGDFNADRSVNPTDDEEDPDPKLRGRSQTWSLFATGTWRPYEGTTVSLSGRYNHTSVRTTDQLDSTSSLNSDYTYSKINPAIGATYALTPAVTLYANAQQGNRAPSPIELGCSDPAEPCKLPNAMQADPRLDQVVTRGIEIGMRGTAGPVRWNAAAFGAVNRDDILFVSSNTVGQGYFKNFGKTRRTGVELGLSGDYGSFTWNAGYTWVDATYRSSECIVSAENSEAGNQGCGADNIRVESGDKIPGIAEHSFKLGLNWRAADWLTLGSDVVTHSGVYARGNENNDHDENGKTSGFTVVNLVADADLGAGWSLFARVNNLFDKRYFTAAQIGENPFTGPNNSFDTDTNNWEDETFYAPGAPRAGWIGVRYRFGG
jgi:iron complex outermembrane recepter protein